VTLPAKTAIDILVAAAGLVFAVGAVAFSYHKECERLKKEQEEECRIHGTIEFRRGKRTGGQWLPFCPRCKLPADDTFTLRCSQYPKDCGWITLLGASDVTAIAEKL